MSVSGQKPIYESMFDAGIVSEKMFSMCLGKNGGFMQIGGFNTDQHLEEVKWFKMKQSTGTSYKFKISGVAINKHLIDGSSDWSTGFVDSGTTFTYLPPKMWDQLMLHFDYFCEETKNLPDSEKYCPGERFLTKS